MVLTIWHNPRCSTSRRTLAGLEQAGGPLVVRRYLDDPPTVAELRALGLPAADLIRWKEVTDFTPDQPEDELFARLAAAPQLLQRPVVIDHGAVWVGKAAAERFAAPADP